MRLACCLLLLLLAACNRGNPPDTVVVRDSAGVRIVESVTPQWTAETAWRLSAEPLVDIGGGDTDEQQLFRVVGALRLADGSIVVANAGTSELRFYDDGGQYLRSAGGEGDGPGEFRQIRWVQRLGEDSLAAYDRRQRRLSVFDREGRFVRSLLLESVGGRPARANGVLTDGRVLASSTAAIGPPRSGRYRAPVTLLLYAADGSRGDSMGSNAGVEVFIHRRTSGGIIVMPAPFGRFATTVVHGDRLLTGATDEYELRTFTPDGRLTTIVRRLVPQRPIRNDDVAAELARLLDLLPDADLRRDVERAMRDSPLPEVTPAFGGPVASIRLGPSPSFRVDAKGNLWVQEYETWDESEPQWSVFDTEGVLQGTLSVPTGVTLIDIGDDYVLGLWRDDLDVEFVQLYELVKPAS